MQHVSYGYARLFAHKRLVVVLYFLNLLFAAAAVFPLFRLYNAVAGESLIGQAPGGLNSLNFVSDLLAHHPSGFTTAMAAVLLGLVIHQFFSLFTAGGILSVVQDSDGGHQPRTFWGGAGHWFGPFLRHMLWCLPLLIVPFLGALLVNGIWYVIWGDDPMEGITYYRGWVRAAVVIAGLFWWLRVLEYGRNEMLTSNHRSGRKAMWRGLCYVMKNLIGTMGLGLAFVVPGTVLWYCQAALTQAEAGAAVFLGAQVMVLVRMGLKVGLYAGQLHGYQERHPPIQPAQPDVPRGFDQTDEVSPGAAGADDAAPTASWDGGEGASSASVEEAPRGEP